MKFLVSACDCGQFYIFQVVYYPELRLGLSVCAPFVFSQFTLSSPCDGLLPERQNLRFLFLNRYERRERKKIDTYCMLSTRNS